MRNVKFLSKILLLTVTVISCQNRIIPPEALLPIPYAHQLAWQDLETYAFIHFTTNTFTDKEWGYGDEDPIVFNPTKLDVEQWVTIIKEAGLKGIILTTKHHDGFCLWQSKFTEHNIAKSPYKKGKGDLVKEVSEACRKQGLLFGVYLSPWDRNFADYGKPEYIDYYRNQLKELITEYGPFFEIWFDGANGGDGYYGGAREKRKIDGKTYYDWENTIKIVRELNPGAILFSDAGPDIRWCGNERGIAGKTNWNTINKDTLYAGKPNIEKLLNEGAEDGASWVPAEVDVSIRPGWFYHAHQDTMVRSAENLFKIYLETVGRGANLLLNIPPDKRGLIHENDVKVLKEWKALIDSEFKNNLATNAKVTADSYRGKSKLFAASNVTDGNKKTYWTTDDEIKKGSLEMEFQTPKTVKYIVIQEFIKLGQRVKTFDVEVWENETWKKVISGTTVGHKRILPVEPVTTSKIRLIIKDSKACPLISNIEVY
ncbi:MAG: alpha-L-fucosidase [Tannerella sp.]|jgi:alpha-L-fucosidase|nr:alpha-L-fucosidase [Tannerella sp.]